MVKFGTRLKEVRLRVKKTQDELADILGVARRTVIAYEKSKSTPNIEDFSHIIKTLRGEKYVPNLNPDYLLGLSDDIIIEHKPVSEVLGLSEQTVNDIKNISLTHSKMFSKFLGVKNLFNMLSTLDKVNHYNEVLKQQNIDTEIKNDVMMYGQWLMDRELQFCLNELTFKDLNSEKDLQKYNEHTQTILKPKRDRYEQMVSFLTSKKG